MPGHADDVPPLDELVEEIELFVPEIVLPDIELDLTRLVPEVGKDGLAMVPDNVDPSRGRDALRTLVMRDLCVFCLDLLHGHLTVECGREDGDAFLLECMDLVEPCLVECRILGGAGHGKNTRGLGEYVS